MSKLLPIMGLTVSFTAPAVAGTGPNPAPPTTERSCEKAKMHWDATNKKCCSSKTSSGRCM
jgi:hypothetical protein